MQTDISQATIQKLLTTMSPAFSPADAVRIARYHFGIHGKAQPLVSDRDQNFQLLADDHVRYIVKIANHTEQLQTIDFQNCAMLHIAEKDASIPLPRVIPARDGQFHCIVEDRGQTYIARVLSWLEGTILDNAERDSSLLVKLGELLARMDLSLQDFDHPCPNPPSLWDMKRAAGLGELLIHIEEPGLRQLIRQTLERFGSHVKPTLDSLRTQVIHNDMNLGNVLVDSTQPCRISGIIDFGDLSRSPPIIDLAIAAAYQLNEGDDPLAGALPLIRGYHAIRPLRSVEMGLLTDLVRTRLMTSLLINTYRTKLFPENSDYLLNSYHAAKNALLGLARLGSDDALERVRLACTSA